MNRRGISRVVGLIIFVMIVGLAVFSYSYEPERLFEVSFLDVGQGDSILIETPNGRVILIDGGPDKKVLRRLSEELPFWERRIDLLILTHPHQDHYEGLKSVARRYRVDSFLTNDAVSASPSYQEFLYIIKEEAIPTAFVTTRSEAVIDGVRLAFLEPDTSLEKEKLSNLNDASVVIKLSYGEIDFLLTGDAEIEIEEELLSEVSEQLEAEVLKLGHHGSETSSTEAFLLAVKPQVAVASAGQGNSYGHPSERTVKRLERLGLPLKRTDLEGTVRFKSDGRTLFD